MATKGSAGVFERAWNGFTDFFTEFTAGPPRRGSMAKTKWPAARVRKHGQALKKKKLRGVKSTIIKPEPAAVKREVKVLYELQNTQPKVEQFEKEPNWNSVIEDKQPEQPKHEADVSLRVDAIETAQKTKEGKRSRNFFETQPVARNRKHLLFMNPGTNKILEALQALNAGEPLPVWAESFRELLTVDGNKLYFNDLETY